MAGRGEAPAADVLADTIARLVAPDAVVMATSTGADYRGRVDLERALAEPVLVQVPEERIAVVSTAATARLADAALVQLAALGAMATHQSSHPASGLLVTWLVAPVSRTGEELAEDPALADLQSVVRCGSRLAPLPLPTPWVDGSRLTAVLPDGPGAFEQAWHRARHRPGAAYFDERWRRALSSTVGADLRWNPDGSIDTGSSANSVALGYVRAGVPRREFAADAGRSPWLAGRLASEADDWLRQVWSSATAQVIGNGGAMDTAVVLDRVAATIDHRLWPARTGPADRAVLSALLTLARKLQSAVVGCSHRELVQLGAVGSPTTAAKALQRLIGDQLIVQTDGGSASTSARYRLIGDIGVGWCSQSSTSSSPSMEGGRELTAPASTDIADGLHDAFAGRHGLPLDARDTYLALIDDWRSVEEILACRPAGTSAAAVLRHLNAMADVRLAVRNSPRGRRWRRGPATPYEVAGRRGSAGTLARATERMDRQRAADAARRRAYRDAQQTDGHGPKVDQGVPDDRFDVLEDLL